MAFNLNDYEDVAARIRRVHDNYPMNRFNIREMKVDHEKGYCWVITEIYRDANDPFPAVCDAAYEFRSDRGVNKDFWVENCVTSSYGRSAGLLLGSEKRSTKQDMEKVARIENDLASERIANSPLAINNTWDEFVGKEPSPEPVSLEEAAQLVQQTFGEAEPIPTCSHGVRTIKSGVSASGKAWQGAMCEVRGASKGDRCPAIWYVMSKTTGKWRLPEGVE
jgi:hypothetical protein